MTDVSNTASYFRPRRLGHVNIWVDDLKRSERFYNECCGLTIEFSEPDLIATFLGTGQTPHDLGMMEADTAKALEQDYILRTIELKITLLHLKI